VGLRTIWFPRPLDRELGRVADDLGISVSKLVSRLVARGLEAGGSERILWHGRV